MQNGEIWTVNMCDFGRIWRQPRQSRRRPAGITAFVYMRPSRALSLNPAGRAAIRHGPF